MGEGRNEFPDVKRIDTLSAELGQEQFRFIRRNEFPDVKRIDTANLRLFALLGHS